MIVNKFEVRGYEVAQLMPDGSWRAISKYKDTDIARLQANADAKWFNERGRGTFQVRALVSCEFPKADQLVLDADHGPISYATTGGDDVPPEVVEAMISDVELEAKERESCSPQSTPSSEFDPTSE